MSLIHSTAIIDSSAQIDESAEVGPYCVIGKGVVIKKNVSLLSNVVVSGLTTIDEGTKVWPFSVLGGDPQDLKYNGEGTQLVIGDNNIFREYCTVNRGTVTGYHETKIGSDNLFMAYSHIAHDCIIKNNCILSNAASLAGHVRLGNYVSLGGFTLVHQFCDIGDYAFSGLGTVISRDVTPYTLVAGNHARAYKINTAGLKRKGFSDDVILSLEKTFKLFIKSKSNREEVLKSFKKLNILCSEVDNFISFINNSERGVTR